MFDGDVCTAVLCPFGPRDEGEPERKSSERTGIEFVVELCLVSVGIFGDPVVLQCCSTGVLSSAGISAQDDVFGVRCGGVCRMLAANVSDFSGFDATYIY